MLSTRERESVSIIHYGKKKLTFQDLIYKRTILGIVKEKKYLINVPQLN